MQEMVEAGFSYPGMIGCICSGGLVVHEFRDVHEVFEFSCFLQVVCQEADALYIDFSSAWQQPNRIYVRIVRSQQAKPVTENFFLSAFNHLYLSFWCPLFTVIFEDFLF